MAMTVLLSESQQQQQEAYGDEADDLDFEDGFGMTAARQAEVRGALFNMLGSSVEGQASVAGQSSGHSQENSRSVSGSSRPVPLEQWSCTVCTLINDPGRVVCKACGCSHMSE